MWGHAIGSIVTLILSMVVALLAVDAQPAGKVYHIGVLETTSATLNVPNLDAFRRGLRKLGYIEGQNLVISTARRTAARALPGPGNCTGASASGPHPDARDASRLNGQKGHPRHNTSGDHGGG